VPTAPLDGGLPAAPAKDQPFDGGREPGELLFEVDGPNVHPTTVDALSLLEMAAAFFSLVAAEAVQAGTQLDFHGLEVLDKCAAVRVNVSDKSTAISAARQAQQVLRGASPPPRGGSDPVKLFRKAAQRFEAGVPTFRIAAITAEGQLPIAIPKDPRSRPMDTLVTLRAKPVRVGGDKPAVRFSSVLERDEFTLGADADLARRLGNELYREVELAAIIERGKDGVINGGKVLGFEVVDASVADPWGAWRKWYQDVNRE
jgi:hypothetical protein